MGVESSSAQDEDILVQDLATSNWRCGPSDRPSPLLDFRQCSYFGIYDGHGGRDCVNFVSGAGLVADLLSAQAPEAAHQHHRSVACSWRPG